MAVQEDGSQRPNSHRRSSNRSMSRPRVAFVFGGVLLMSCSSFYKLYSISVQEDESTGSNRIGNQVGFLPEDNAPTKMEAASLNLDTTIERSTETSHDEVTGNSTDSYNDEETNDKESHNTTSTATSTATTTNTSTSTDSLCDSHRFWNLNDPFFHNDDNMYGLLTDPRHYFNQTLCHSESNWIHNPQNNESSSLSLLRWMYMGLHWHQHAPARDEYLQRRQQQQTCNCTETPWESSQFSFQCPDTQFLVASLPTMGMGATFRMGAVPLLLAGLAMNRTVIFLNSIPNATNMPREFRGQWPLASCPRHDYQCTFLPITPCTITWEELQSAAVVSDRVSVQRMLKQGRVFRKYNQSRIVAFVGQSLLPAMGSKGEERMRQRLYEVMEAYNRQPQSPNIQPQALKRLWIPSWQQPQTNATRASWYHHATSLLHHAALLYVLRPNSRVRHQMEAIVNPVVRPVQSPNSKAFGLPIRASDKCQKESTCLTFDHYMELVQQQSYQHVILTSESRPMMEARHEYVSSRWTNQTGNSTMWNYTFLVNEHDVLQGTGRPSKNSFQDQADAVLLSSLIALHMQLHADSTIVNCCSSFHHIYLDLLRNQCGKNPDPNFMCLQETEDPKFHVCCAWHAKEECDQIRSNYKTQVRTKGGRGQFGF